MTCFCRSVDKESVWNCVSCGVVCSGAAEGV